MSKVIEHKTYLTNTISFWYINIGWLGNRKGTQPKIHPSR